jgi:hypothetical protein
MTKEEIVDLVELAYASFRVEFPEEDSKQAAVWRAWYELLGDVEYSEAKKALMVFAVSGPFMPKPGEIRRSAINTRIGITQFDAPYVAWGKWLTLSREVNSGMPPSMEVSPALSKTVKLLGESAYGMHTNGDREVFCQVYESAVKELESDMYKIPE